MDDDPLDYISVPRTSVPMRASMTWHSDGVSYTQAKWNLRCRLEKIEQMLARVIKHIESVGSQ